MRHEENRSNRLLKQDRPAFHAVSPESIAELAEMVEEGRLETLAQSRLKWADMAKKVSLDDL